MPLNAYSHLQAEATPFKSQFKVSYHLYEALPQHTQEEWQAEIKFDIIGTVYASDQAGSAAAKRIEASWERLWEDGRPGWTTIERMITDQTALLEMEHESKTIVAIESKTDSIASRTELPLATGLQLFMFSSKPSW
jgi:hypothetical protein